MRIVEQPKDTPTPNQAGKTAQKFDLYKESAFQVKLNWRTGEGLSLFPTDPENQISVTFSTVIP